MLRQCYVLIALVMLDAIVPHVAGQFTLGRVGACSKEIIEGEQRAVCVCNVKAGTRNLRRIPNLPTALENNVRTIRQLRQTTFCLKQCESAAKKKQRSPTLI